MPHIVMLLQEELLIVCIDNLFCKYMSRFNIKTLFTVYHMKESGWVKISTTDVGPLYYEYKAEA